MITDKHSELQHTQKDFKSSAKCDIKGKKWEIDTLGRAWTGDKTNLLTNKFVLILFSGCLEQTKTVLGKKYYHFFSDCTGIVKHHGEF